ncbi:ABC transporter substrate-binding protein [Streptococcus sp. S784/96/1]|uniref:ABC transporter substrate-binding protein n=1 Tax=Streptococcus sp. S784/96/1 TaxID=2653499 RepID=UPI001386D92C|nr:extracellular solute-binding protein [Streptococcus sp. S784/96/1]
MKKSWKLLAVTLCGAALLVACGPKASDTKSKEGDKSGTITVWSAFSGPDLENYQKTIDAYNATNPAYKVKMVPMKADTLKQKLTTAGKSGTGLPDIAELASEQLPYYKDLGLLDSWDSLIKGSDVSAEHYVPATWEIGTLDGKQYGVPDKMDTWVMYYNQDLVDKYAPGSLDDGIVTYAEVEKAGEAAKADGIYATSNDWSSQNFMNIYLQMGGEWRDSSGKFNIDNDIAKKAWGEWEKLYSKGYVVPNGEDAVKAFMNGKVIFNPEGTWMLSQYQGIKDFKWGEMLTLQWDEKNLIQASGAGQFAIFKTKEGRSKNLEKGMVDFLAWLQTNQGDIVKSGANPTALAMLEDENYTKLPQSFLVTDEKAQNAITINTDPGMSPFMTAFDPKGMDMISGKAELDATFNQIQQTVAAQINE